MNKTKIFINKSLIIHGNLYKYDLVEYVNSVTPVKIKCDIHGEFQQKPINHTYFKCGCPKCAGKKYDKKIFLEKCKIKHNNIYDYSLVDYKTMHIKIKIICPVHNIFEQTPLNHLYYGCKQCSFDNQRNKSEDIILKFKEIHSDRFDYSLVKYTSMNKKIKIICPIHGIFNQTPTNHMQRKGCYRCSPNRKKDVFEILHKLNNIHNKKYQYDNVFDKTSVKIRIICDKHGVFYQTLNNHLDKHGCPFCNESRGEKIINEYLIKNNINHQRQKTFLDCRDNRKLPFDFYLNDYNLCIEFDGIQHFMIIEHWGGGEKFDIIKKHDLLKNDFCNKNSINLLRINYKEDIYEKLKKYLDIFQK